MEIFSGSPEVCANMAPIVQVAPGMAYPPLRVDAAPEKSSCSSAIFVSSGIVFCGKAPPEAWSAKVTSVDSMKM